MDREQLWALIEAAKAATADDCRAQAAHLVAALRQRPVSEVLDYDRVEGQLLAESYSWDLWGAAYLVNDGCSDGGFDCFRGWLLGQGRATWQAALADPDSLASHPLLPARSSQQEPFNRLECEDILGVVYRAFQALTGQELTVEVAGMRPSQPSWARTGTSTTPPRCGGATPGSGRCAAGTGRRLDTIHHRMS